AGHDGQERLERGGVLGVVLGEVEELAGAGLQDLLLLLLALRREVVLARLLHDGLVDLGRLLFLLLLFLLLLFLLLLFLLLLFLLLLFLLLLFLLLLFLLLLVVRPDAGRQQQGQGARPEQQTVHQRCPRKPTPPAGAADPPRIRTSLPAGPNEIVPGD